MINILLIILGVAVAIVFLTYLLSRVQMMGWLKEVDGYLEKKFHKDLSKLKDDLK